MPAISIIIPVYNGEKTIKTCLSAVNESLFKEYETILVDDGSTDRTVEIASNFECQIIELDQNHGVAYARNQGAMIARGEILFFLDADIRIDHDSLEKIAQSFQRRPEISALFGSYQIDTPVNSFYSKYKNLLHHFTHQTSQENAATFCGGFGAIRRDVFIDFGGFRETYNYLEDIEFGYRLHQKGHKIRLDKDLQFTHLKNYSLIDLIRSDMFGRAKPWTEIMLEKRIIRNDLNTRAENAFSLLVSGLILAAVPVLFIAPFAWFIFCGLVVTFLVLNRNFLALVFQEKGFLFLIKSIFLNWFGYLYSGVGLLLGAVNYLVNQYPKIRSS